MFSDTIIYICQFVMGLILVVKGADFLTTGGSDIARLLNVSSLLIGLTIVAFGTSLPEFVVSTIAATKGNSDMSLGNVVGSNIFNTLGVVGITALFCPVVCKGSLFNRDIPVNVFASLLVTFLLLFCGNKGELNRTEGIILLTLFAIYISISIYQSVKSDKAKPTKQQENGKNIKQETSVMKSVVMIVIGLSALILGGDWFVDGASGIATQLGVSQSIIALTIVSIGTSLPELATSVIAARKGDTDMAMGNVVGSNIFNLLLIIGTAATITPIKSADISYVDFTVMASGSIMLWLSCLFGRERRITFWEGLLFVIIVAAYYTYLIMNSNLGVTA